MPRPLKLEAFAPVAPVIHPPEEAGYTAADLEAARLEGYETGYKSGWEDALARISSDQGQIGEEFARNLRDLGFTYHEARAHLIASVEPLISALISALFPAYAAQTIGLHVTGAALGLFEETCDVPVRLRVSAEDAAALRAILPDDPGFSCQVVEEPAMAQGQAQMILGAQEHQIDLSAVTGALDTALAALHAANEEALEHG